MNITEEIMSIQALQQFHDERYHHDIFVLMISQKLTHFCMHLAKYNGSMWEDGSPENVLKKLVDSFIIVSSCANTLRMNMCKHTISQLALESEATLDEATSLLHRQLDQRGVSCPVYKMTILVGHMSKALEALDHVEDYPSRRVLEATVKDMWLHLLACLHSRIDRPIQAYVRDRLMNMESRHMFFKYLGCYDNGYIGQKTRGSTDE
jgi:hypothetical protein